MGFEMLKSLVFPSIFKHTDVRQRNKELTKQKKRMLEIQSRMKELDNLFQRIYEDNISGKLSGTVYETVKGI